MIADASGVLVHKTLMWLQRHRDGKAQDTMSEERRRSPRSRVLQRGQIVYRNGHSVIDCVLLDLSAGGARLKLPSWLGVPDRFELRIEHGPRHDAAVCHCGFAIGGVRFLSAPV